MALSNISGLPEEPVVPGIEFDIDWSISITIVPKLLIVGETLTLTPVLRYTVVIVCRSPLIGSEVVSPTTATSEPTSIEAVTPSLTISDGLDKTLTLLFVLKKLASIGPSAPITEKPKPPIEVAPNAPWVVIVASPRCRAHSTPYLNSSLSETSAITMSNIT